VQILKVLDYQTHQIGLIASVVTGVQCNANLVDKEEQPTNLSLPLNKKIYSCSVFLDIYARDGKNHTFRTQAYHGFHFSSNQTGFSIKKQSSTPTTESLF
jgi:hypothetical protein